MMKNSTMAVCTFWQALSIVPLWIPLILVNFFPFILFGSLFLVLLEIYRSNELVSFKAMGISNRKMLKIVGLFGFLSGLFFLVLSTSYPYTTKMFFKKKNEFNVTNLLRALTPNKINNFGKYKVFFTDIDKQNVIHNITILSNEKPKDRQTYEKKDDKVIFAERLLLGFNEYDEIIGRGQGISIFSVGFGDNNRDKSEDIRRPILLNGNDIATDKQEEQLIKNAFYAEDMDVLFDELLNGKRNYNNAFSYKNKLRQMDIFKLFRVKARNQHEVVIKQMEIQGRIIHHWFVILCLVSVFCLMLRRTSNRKNDNKDLIVIFTFGSYFALNKAFVLESVLSYGTILCCMYYLHLFLLACLFIFLLLKSDKRTRIDKNAHSSSKN